MNKVNLEIQNFPLWEKLRSKGAILSVNFEITSRCNLNCRHCYINNHALDTRAKSTEISIDQIDEISDQAIKYGAIWCLLTGGEPLIRPDFEDIYLLLKKKGLLLSVFTNANLISNKHIKLFTEYPPRDIEVTVYGVTKHTYETISRVPGSFHSFIRGLDLLTEANINIRLKAMALKSNYHEMDQIRAFCEERTKDFYRFDPVLHLRYDRNEKRNQDIISERLSPAEIVALENSDTNRLDSLLKNCAITYSGNSAKEPFLFQCGIGNGEIIIGPDGNLRICSALWEPSFLQKSDTLKDIIQLYSQIARAHSITSTRVSYVDNCLNCAIRNLCLWCPAHAYLETGELDGETPYFCQVAHARAEMLRNATQK